MVSQIDPTLPADGVPAVKSDLRVNLLAAKDEIEALQTGKTDLGHTHLLADISDAGALAARDDVTLADVTDSGALAARDDVTLADVTDSGALAARDDVTLADVTDAGTLAGRNDVDGLAIDMQDQLLTRPEIKDFAETTTAPSINSGSLTLDLSNGNVFDVVLTEDITALGFANAPAAGRVGSVTLILQQDASGGRTVDWPAAVKWSGGEAPTESSAADAVDVYAFVTRDAGVTWFGFPGGKDFS